MKAVSKFKRSFKDNGQKLIHLIQHPGKNTIQAINGKSISKMVRQRYSDWCNTAYMNYFIMAKLFSYICISMSVFAPYCLQWNTAPDVSLVIGYFGCNSMVS